MGKPGRSHARGLICALVLLTSLASSVILLPPAGAAAGDLAAPVYSDGDWWNHTWRGEHTVLAKVGDYEVGFEQVSGWMKLTVDGTTSYLGKVSWVMKVTGRVKLTGDWTSAEETGTTTLDADVSGVEYRSATDLALLGSSVSFAGQVEIATLSGPEHYDMVVWENVTLDRPLRMLLFPVPIATLPKENHTVSIIRNYESGTHSAQRVEVWSYMAEYKGLADVQGNDVTFTDQNAFSVKGNVTVGEGSETIDMMVYYDKITRKAVTVDESRDLVVSTYQIAAAVMHPDLVVADGEFNVTDYEPTEGTEVNFTGIVHNLGTVEVVSIDVELWASLDDDRPVRQNSTRIPSMPAHEKAVVHFNWTAEEVGLWEFFFRVDPINVITENREDNNEATLQMVVSYDVPKPNLYVVEEDGIVMDPPSPVSNRTALRITVTVGNDGPGTAYNVTVDLYLGEPGEGGVKIGWRDTIDQVPSGETRKAWINWGANVPGNLVIWAYLDANNTVDEEVETDNTGSAPLIVVATPHGEVDLVVASIKMLDSNGLELQPYPHGDAVTVRTTISNVESNRAERVHMSVYVDTEDPEGLIGSHEGPVDAKGLVSWEVTWTVDREDGDHQLIVTVVAVGDVEATYKDNVGTYDFQVGPRSYPDPEPLEITIFPDNTVVKPGQVIQVSGKVTIAKNGFEVSGASVYVQVRGQNAPVEVATNELGRYLANITMPDKPGNYRLEAQVRQGLSEGDNSLMITVERSTTSDPGGEEDGDMSLTFFVASIVVLLAVLMPVTYYILVSRAEMKRRIRRVHEEIVEIVEDEE